MRKLKSPGISPERAASHQPRATPWATNATILVGKRSILSAIVFLLSLAVPSFGEDLPRFFFEGNGRLVLRHARFETTLDVRYRRADGNYDPAALKQIEHFFRSREDGREAPVPLRLVELLSYIQDHYHPRQMILLSGFRSPEFNTELRNAGGAAAQASLHTEAMAADVMFVGVDMGRVWHRLRDLGTGGVGYYRQNKFLHIDTGPPRFWEATTSRVRENLSADNARVFLATDFDRYRDLKGASCVLHSVTAYPIMISSHARVVGADEASLTIEPPNGADSNADGCFVVSSPERREFRVTSVRPGAANSAQGESRIVLSTCEPRLGKTPAEITSNPIEIRRR
ncbi:MAG: DUF882 domain-containing protein [Candidatus Binatia bacterium]|jgi:uncharacterized protein YcbK (DUF882 family)